MTNYDRLLKTLKDEVSYLETYIKEKRQEIEQDFDASSDGREKYRNRIMYFEGKESVLITLKSIVKITEELNN